MANTQTHGEDIPHDVLAEVSELARGAEVLPEPGALALKLLEARRQGRPLRVKLGFDPTSPDLHLGHAVVLRALARFQKRGHKVVIIVGGFTAQIGDPTGRNSTRPPLTDEAVADNARTYLEQVGLILDVEKAEVRNNAEWLGRLDLPAMVRLMSRVTVNQLLAKEAFGGRIEKQAPVALHELAYPLLQAFDSVEVKADVEIGGTDQRFNVLFGRQLQASFGEEPQVALLLPILAGTDGVKKMSKSLGNAIALKDAPDDMFGKVMRLPDALILTFFELATTMSRAGIEGVRAALAGGGNPKDAKELLATTIVREIHGEEAAQKALAAWRRVHSERQAPAEIAQSHVVAAPVCIVDLLAACGLAASKNQARKFVQEGGVRLNNEKVTDIAFLVPVPEDGGAVLSHGRRKFVRLLNR
ncbi:MAG TPA: tyrosine--tRNA ligase [Candidatus Obscuribacterales bacterium]